MREVTLEDGLIYYPVIDVIAEIIHEEPDKLDKYIEILKFWVYGDNWCDATEPEPDVQRFVSHMCSKKHHFDKGDGKDAYPTNTPISIINKDQMTQLMLVPKYLKICLALLQNELGK